jgi:hypothetical protein
VAAPPLPPRVTVVPDIVALDLETDNAGALDRDDEVHLMVLEVVGDTLARNHQAVCLKLFPQGRPCGRGELLLGFCEYVFT